MELDAQQAKSYWIDSLMAVDGMLSMHADDPDNGCTEALQAGHKVRHPGTDCYAHWPVRPVTKHARL